MTEVFANRNKTEIKVIMAKAFKKNTKMYGHNLDRQNILLLWPCI